MKELTEEEKSRIYSKIKELFTYTAPEAREWKFSEKIVPLIEHIFNQKG